MMWCLISPVIYFFRYSTRCRRRRTPIRSDESPRRREASKKRAETSHEKTESSPRPGASYLSKMVSKKSYLRWQLEPAGTDVFLPFSPVISHKKKGENKVPKGKKSTYPLDHINILLCTNCSSCEISTVKTVGLFHSTRVTAS